MESIDFLRTLERKLKGLGDRRSIYLNAVVGQSQKKLDLASLAEAESQLPIGFLRDLLEKPEFKVKIRLPDLDAVADDDERRSLSFTRKRLDVMRRDFEDMQQEFGTDNFGFGYPILFRKIAGNKHDAAPIFVWGLKISKSSDARNEWTISRKEDFPIVLNPVLKAQLESENELAIEDFSSDEAEGSLLGEAELHSRLLELLQKIDFEVNEPSSGDLESVPTKESIGRRRDHSWGLSPSGVFGIFKPQRASILKDLDELIRRGETERQASLPIPTSTLSSILTDPSQERVLLETTRRSPLVIHGPPGTGKSQTLTAIITQSLFDGKRILVVCEKRTALEVLERNLKEKDLSRFSVIIEQTTKDRRKVVDRVRELQEEFRPSSVVGSNYGQEQRAFDYKASRRNYEKGKDEVNARHRAVFVKVLGDETWKSAVGKFFRAVRKANANDAIMSSMPKSMDFKETPEELDRLREVASEAEKRRIPDRENSAFLSLKKGLFKGEYTRRKKNELEETLSGLAKDSDDALKELRSHMNRMKKRSMSLCSMVQSMAEGLQTACEKGNATLRSDVRSLLQKLDDKAKSFRQSLSKAAYLEQEEDDARRKALTLQSEAVTFQNSFLVPLKEALKELSRSNHETLVSDLEREAEQRQNFLRRLGTTFSSPFSTANKSLRRRRKELRKRCLRWLEAGNRASNYIRSNEPAKARRRRRNPASMLSQSRGYFRSLLDLGEQLDQIKTVEGLPIDSSFRKELGSEPYFNLLRREHFQSANLPFGFETVEGETFLQDASLGLASLIDNLKNLSERSSSMLVSLDDADRFRRFYEWQRMWNEDLNDKERRLVLALESCSEGRWTSLVEAWYYKNVIEANEERLAPFHEDDSLIQECNEHREQLTESHSRVVRDMVEDRIRSVFGSHEPVQVQRLFMKISSKNRKRLSLRGILARKDGFNIMTTCFPVLMVNPEVASTILPLRKNLFDLVLFDEASQLRLEDAFTSYYRGAVKVVSGDAKQMAPSSFFQKEQTFADDDEDDDTDEEEAFERDHSRSLADSESLLEYAVESGEASDLMLEFHYRSNHPDLIGFSNAAFYKGKLKPMPAKSNEPPISFHEVNGTYIHKTNDEEADFVVGLLFDDDVVPLRNGKCPSVGVATFNLEQRNLILEKIEQRVSEAVGADHPDRLKYAALKDHEDSLFVKNLENIQGDERDVIFLSTTFGLNPEGKFKQRFGPLSNKSKGHRLLNVIVTRAKQKVHVCCSIPSEHYSNYEEELQQNGNTGRGVLYAYLAYSRAVSIQDSAARDRILACLFEASGGAKEEARSTSDDGGNLTESPFEEEVLEELKEHIDASRIKAQFPVGGFRIDLVIMSRHDATKPLLAVECDGKSYHSSQQAHIHDRYREERIREALPDLEFYRIWSTNWWREQQDEVKRLVSAVKRKDKENAKRKLA